MCWVINFARKKHLIIDSEVWKGGERNFGAWRFEDFQEGDANKNHSRKKKKTAGTCQKKDANTFWREKSIFKLRSFFGWQVVILREFQSGKKTEVEVLTCPCRNECDWDVAVCTIASFPCKQPRSNLDKAKSWGKRSKTITASQRINRLRNLTFVGCTTEEFTAGQFVRVVPWRQNWMCSVMLHDFVISFQSATQVFKNVDSIGRSDSIRNIKITHMKNLLKQMRKKTYLASLRCFSYLSGGSQGQRWAQRQTWLTRGMGRGAVETLGFTEWFLLIIFTSICWWIEIHFDSNLKTMKDLHHYEHTVITYVSFVWSMSCFPCIF